MEISRKNYKKRDEIGENDKKSKGNVENIKKVKINID